MIVGEARLRRELRRLQVALGCGHDLKLVWDPDHVSNLEGEVKGRTIYVYSRSMRAAVKTLRHEFLDYAVTQLIEPYREVTNALIALVNRQAYTRKEKLVEALASILSRNLASIRNNGRT